MAVDIQDLEIDDVNEAKAAAHGVSAAEVLQLLDGDFRLFRNKRGRTGTHVLIGRTHGGRFLTVPVVPTSVEGVWRVITAWPSSDAEKAKYQK